MVHADSSKFQDGLSKKETYERVLQEAEALFDGQRNWVCNLSNTASLLWHAFKSLDSPSNHVNWAGFYIVDSAHADQLILGPFQGKVACQVIAIGRGVCGVAAQRQQSVLVSDVDMFPGHIACDGDTRSEIVVPIVAPTANGSPRLVAIIDIDCTILNGFDKVDQEYLQKLAALIGQSCDWP